MLKSQPRDLARQPPPHLDEATIAAFYTPIEQLRDDQKEILSLSDDLITELEGADVVVIGAPMHNFSVPSGLKAYIDHVARVGRTFHYTENGPKRFIAGEKSLCSDLSRRQLQPDADGRSRSPGTLSAHHSWIYRSR